MTLSPYSKKSVCPKCEQSEVLVRWCGGYRVAHRFLSGEVDRTCMYCARVNLSKDIYTDHDRDAALLEHMCRTCSTCCYVWGEIPLDQCPPLVQLAACAESVSEDPASKNSASNGGKIKV